MRYFKNTDLARFYNISEGTVRRWINATVQGKTDLHLYEYNGRLHIANITKNVQIIEALVAQGKKYTNSRWHQVIRPSPEFYKLYTKKHIADIITKIDVHKELPLQYLYFGEGAKEWDRYARKLWDEPRENMVTAANKLLESNFGNIRRIAGIDKRVNVIDLTVGNALPVKSLLSRLRDEGVLERYVAIDFSQDMIDLAKAYINEWFKRELLFEGHLRDLTYERFSDVLIRGDSDIINFVTFLGGTMQNFKFEDEALKAIHNSMGKNDILITSTKLDTPESRRYFDLEAENEDNSLPKVGLGLKYLLKSLNLDETLYESDEGYDPVTQMRYCYIRPRLDLTIEFDIDNDRQSIHLPKNKPLLLWRYWHHSTSEYLQILERNGFALSQASLTNDHQFILTVSKVLS